jgi:hypothetical protein
MSDATVNSDPGNGPSDELLDLLATPVSKDYINCVWSNEPLENRESPGSPKKACSGVSDHEATCHNASSDQAVSSKNTVLKGKSSCTSNKSAESSDQVSTLKKSVKKRKVPLVKNSNQNSDQVSLPRKRVKKVKKPCVEVLNRKLSAQYTKTTLVENPIESEPKLQAVHSSYLAKSLKGREPETPSEQDEILFSFYKSLVTSPLLPPYQPKQIDSRFFSGTFFTCRACGDK